IRQRVAEGPAAARVLDEMLFGGFLIYYAPGATVYIDDRCELYGEKELNAYVDACWRQPETIDEWSRQYDARTALVKAGSQLDGYLSKSAGWRCLYRDSAAALFAREPGRPANAPA